MRQIKPATLPFIENIGMAKSAALEALLKAYRDEINWLNTKARNYAGISMDIAADCLHRARGLQTVIEAYERLDGKEPKMPKTPTGAKRPC